MYSFLGRVRYRALLWAQYIKIRLSIEGYFIKLEDIVALEVLPTIPTTLIVSAMKLASRDLGRWIAIAQKFKLCPHKRFRFWSNQRQKHYCKCQRARDYMVAAFRADLWPCLLLSVTACVQSGIYCTTYLMLLYTLRKLLIDYSVKFQVEEISYRLAGTIPIDSGNNNMSTIKNIIQTR